MKGCEFFNHGCENGDINCQEAGNYHKTCTHWPIVAQKMLDQNQDLCPIALLAGHTDVLCKQFAPCGSQIRNCSKKIESFI